MAYNINMLKEMLEKKQIHILSSQLSRSFIGSKNIRLFNIRKKYIIKIFPSKYRLVNNDIL